MVLEYSGPVPTAVTAILFEVFFWSFQEERESPVERLLLLKLLSKLVSNQREVREMLFIGEDTVNAEAVLMRNFEIIPSATKIAEMKMPITKIITHSSINEKARFFLFEDMGSKLVRENISWAEAQQIKFDAGW